MMEELEQKKNELMAENHEIAQKGIFSLNFLTSNLLTLISLRFIPNTGQNFFWHKCCNGYWLKIFCTVV